MPRKQRKTAEAEFWVQLTCDCPYCNEHLDLFETVDSDLIPPLGTTDTDIIVNCPECKESFTVTRVTY